VTWGRVSRYGVFTLANSLDTVGPMCRSAADAAAMMDVIAGHDVNDPTSLTGPVPNYLGSLEGVFGARDLRIGIDWDYVSTDTDPEIVAGIKAALDVYRSIGAQIVPIKVPSVEAAARLQLVIMETECANYHRELFKADPSGFGELKGVIERGFAYDPTVVASAYIEKDRFKGELMKTFEAVDVIAAPVMPKIGILYDELGDVFKSIPQFGRYCGPYNMSGSPTITFPTGMSSIGLPLAMQLIGRHLGEATLLKAGHAFQQATAWHRQRPKLQ